MCLLTVLVIKLFFCMLPFEVKEVKKEKNKVKYLLTTHVSKLGGGGEPVELLEGIEAKADPLNICTQLGDSIMVAFGCFKGRFLRALVPFCDQIFQAPGAKLWHYAAELHSVSVTYLLCGSAPTDTTDNLSEMCPLKLTDFCLFLYHPSYTIFQGPLFPPMACSSCHDRGSNRLPPDGRASTLTTQPLRLA